MAQHYYILYIEDDLEDREVLIDALLSLDAKVMCNTANDGRAALELLSKDLLVMPDFIFCDVNMPVMNGKEFLKNVKQIPRLRSIPVIMYSTTTHPDERAQLLSLGALEVLSKPSAFSDLISLLKRIIFSPDN